VTLQGGRENIFSGPDFGLNALTRNGKAKARRAMLHCINASEKYFSDGKNAAAAVQGEPRRRVLAGNGELRASRVRTVYSMPA
jgi:hypothetical protein